jgi:hypothetical protein
LDLLAQRRKTASQLVDKKHKPAMITARRHLFEDVHPSRSRPGGNMPARKWFQGALIVCLSAFGSSLAWAVNPSFICQEPGGKRLIRIDEKEISKESEPNKTLLYIDGNDILTNPTATATLIVDDTDIRHTAAGVKIAVFDGENLRHAADPNGKVLFNYHYPDVSPDGHANRIYSIEGEAISKQQLVAGLYLLHPEWFKLSDEENAAQLKAMKENAAEQDKKDAADQVAGKWDMLNSSGIMEKVGTGQITVSPKKGDAYPLTFDFTKGEGPQWTGVGIYKCENSDKLLFAAYGTPKTIALCVYEVDGGTLKGTWYPWYGDGTAKNIGTENLKGPATLDGDFSIESAKAPFTGAAYTGTVSIKPTEIVGSSDDSKPYLLTWTIGQTTIKGIGIRTGKYLIVSSGSGADVNIARFKIGNGSMNSDWFKLGSTEHGASAAMTAN